MPEVELEGELFVFFHSEDEERRDYKIGTKIMSRLRVFPRQLLDHWFLGDLTLDWKLDLAWSRVTIFGAFAGLGLIVGSTKPECIASLLRARTQFVTTPAYLMPGASPFYQWHRRLRV
jgi:hypothetical protein